MGKVLRPQRDHREVKKGDNRIDVWFARASHGSQVLLLLLGIFGYFYTVLPVYQKSLLDEDIARKTLELRHQETQSLALAAEIEKKKDELRQKDNQVTLVRNIAAAAKSEAKENYSRLRVEYVGVALQRLRSCNSIALNRDLESGDLSKCPPQVRKEVDYFFVNLRKEDAKLFFSILDRRLQSKSGPFQSIVESYGAKMTLIKGKIMGFEQQIEDSKRDGSSSDQKVRLQASSLALKATLGLMGTRDDTTKLRFETFDLYSKLLNETALEISQEFFEKALP